MSGVQWLYIAKNEKVFTIPRPKNRKYQAVKELAGQNVLKVMLYYETKDQKPERLLAIEFDRIRLDAAGAYALTDEEMKKTMQNAFHFIYTTPQELATREEPIILPLAPSIPSSKEKMALYAYLTREMLSLRKEAPEIVEQSIASLKKLHQEKIDMIKKAKVLGAQLMNASIQVCRKSDLMK